MNERRSESVAIAENTMNEGRVSIAIDQNAMTEKKAPQSDGSLEIEKLALGAGAGVEEMPAPSEEVPGADCTAHPALQPTPHDLLHRRLDDVLHILQVQDQVMRQEAAQKEQHPQRRRDSLGGLQSLAGVVMQVTFMRTIAGTYAGSFLWICNVLAFTLSTTVGLLVAGERMQLVPAAGGADRASPLAAITMSFSLAFTLLTFAASQLPGDTIALAPFHEARILLPLGGPLLLFTIVFVHFLFSRLR